MKNFGIIGVSGYIAPRHLRAIKETENNLVAALDKFDSVGIIDRFFPNTDFFVEFERFDRHLYKLRHEKGINLDFISICTPNYLHDSHIRFSLRQNAHAICEKPLVLNPWNLEALKQIEKETSKKIYSILQLRLHPDIVKLKAKIDNGPAEKMYDIDLTYLTSRGNWYYSSWKGDIIKSGGIATNIGVHFFDMLTWIFGEKKENKVHVLSHDRASGYLEFKKARVRWFLSINFDLLPKNIKEKGQTTYRSISIDGEELEFSSGFTDLHTLSYKKILNNEGFDLNSSNDAINIVHEIRNCEPLGLKGDFHKFAKYKIINHPFNKK